VCARAADSASTSRTIFSSLLQSNVPRLESTSDGSGLSLPSPPPARKLSEHEQLLRDLVDQTVDSTGARLDSLMRGQLKAALAIDRISGVAVKRTVRLFVACLLKHLGLVCAAPC